MTIKELREKMARIATNARAKFDEIKDDTPAERAAEIEREFDAMMAEHDQLAAKVDRLEKLEEAERSAQSGDPRRPRGAEGRAGAGDDPAQISYREAFHAYLRSQGNLGDMDPEARSVLRGGYRDLPTEQRAQTTAAAAGGYTIPTELMSIIVTSMAAHGPMYDADVVTEMVTTGGGAITIPTVDDTASTAEPHVEGASLTDDGGKDVVFGAKTLNAYAWNTEWLRISKELADDSIQVMEQVIGGLLGQRLARIANSQLTVGTGVSAPNGIVTASSLGKTAASGIAITSDEVIDLLHSVDPAYRVGPKVAFMFNDTTLAVLRKLKDGDGNYLWQMGNLQQGIPGTLLGYRYHINQALQPLPAAAAARRVMLFGDLSKYFVRKVGGPLVGAIQDKDFWPGFGIAGYIRFDGELADTAAVKHLITAAD